MGLRGYRCMNVCERKRMASVCFGCLSVSFSCSSGGLTTCLSSYRNAPPPIRPCVCLWVSLCISVYFSVPLFVFRAVSPLVAVFTYLTSCGHARWPAGFTCVRSSSNPPGQKSRNKGSTQMRREHMRQNPCHSGKHE